MIIESHFVGYLQIFSNFYFMLYTREMKKMNYSLTKINFETLSVKFCTKLEMYGDNLI